MAKIKRVMRCYHCGAILQSEEVEEKGYIPRELLNDPRRIKEQVLYCQNCFEAMKDINNGELNQNVDDEILKILDDARASDAMIVYVIDLFSFNGTFKKSIVEKIRNLKLAVLATKFDLFPKNTNKENLEKYVRERFEEVGLKIDYLHILNSNDEEDYKGLFDKCLESRKGHDVYMIGDYTSGKTTIINRCLKHYENKTRRAIKTTDYPGTKAKVLQVPLSNSSFLYELPSLALDLSAVGKVEKDVQKIIIPRKMIKITASYLSEGEAFVCGGLAVLSLIKGHATPIKAYTAEGVEFKKIKESRVDAFLRENYNKRSLRPVSDRLATFYDYDIFEYEMENDGLYHDISIEGIGWCTFKGEGQRMRITLPKGCAVKEALSKVK